MPMSFQLLDVLTPLSDCRQESAERWNGDFGGFVYVLDRFPQRDLGLWVFMCPINFSLFSGYHAEGYHAPPSLFRLPRRGLPRPTALSGYLSEGYHAPPLFFPATTPLHMQSSQQATTSAGLPHQLPRSKITSGYRQVTTPAGSF